PATIFRNVHKLPPATILTAHAGEEPRLAQYWHLDRLAARTPEPIDAVTAADQLDHLLRDSIAKRMIADVPLGAFLSGGVDSSTVVALMQAQSSRPVKTFTIGFDDPAFDEAAHAKAVAQHLGTDHTEITLKADTALDLVARIPDWFDEPLADSSQLPAFLVSEATRLHVTVALSGDGGDELFGGYPKYRHLANLWRRAGSMPLAIRRFGGCALRTIPEQFWRLASADPRIGEKMRRLTRALAAQDIDAAALAIDTVGFATALVPEAKRTLLPRHLAPASLDDLVSRLQLNDTSGYLPDDILTKVDRCSMAVSLEAREPLLDHRVVEYVWSLPPALRRGEPRPKELLRQVLGRYVPDALTDRPKRGFSVPLDTWLCGPLKSWAEDLLSERALGDSGLLDVTRIRRAWQRQQDGIERNGTGLWNVLMLQAWMRRWMPA
ncbi:MAG: asparagine synthetase B family protein, partial [Pseudolabrys sp.]